MLPIGLKASDVAVTFIGCVDEMVKKQFVVNIELYFDSTYQNDTISDELASIYQKEIYVLTPDKIRIINTNDITTSIDVYYNLKLINRNKHLLITCIVVGLIACSVVGILTLTRCDKNKLAVSGVRNIYDYASKKMSEFSKTKTESENSVERQEFLPDQIVSSGTNSSGSMPMSEIKKFIYKNSAKNCSKIKYFFKLVFSSNDQVKNNISSYYQSFQPPKVSILNKSKREVSIIKNYHIG